MRSPKPKAGQDPETFADGLKAMVRNTAKELKSSAKKIQVTSDWIIFTVDSPAVAEKMSAIFRDKLKAEVEPVASAVDAWLQEYGPSKANE